MNDSTLRRLALTVCTAGLLTACQSTELSAPAGRPAPSAEPALAAATRGGSATGLENSALGRARRQASCGPRAPIVSSGVFGPSGGTLIVGSSWVVIPGGALRDTVTITGTAAGDSSSTVILQPAGLAFAKPASLVLDGAGCIPGNSQGQPWVVEVDDVGEIIEPVPTEYDPTLQTLSAMIRRTGGYAIAF